MVFLWALGLAALAVVGFAVWVRVAPLPADRYHVDPLQAEVPATPNVHRILPEATSEAAVTPSPVWAMAPGDLLAAVDAVAMATPGVTRLAGSVAEGRISYVARSRLWGFPDLVTVSAVALEPAGEVPQSALAAISRSRFGQSDLGVNRARLEGWLAALPAPAG